VIDSGGAERLGPSDASSAATVQLHNVVDRVSDAVMVTTRSGVITSWSPAAETIYRRAVDAALGMTITEAVGATVDPAALALSGATLEDTHRAADGVELAVRVSCVEIDGGYLVISSDHSELSRAARHLRTVLDALAEGIVVFDKNGAVASVNPAAFRLFGLDADDDVGAVPTDHAHRFRTFALLDENGDPVPPHERPIMRTLGTGEEIRDQVFGIDRPDGERIWLSGRTCLLDPDDLGDRAVLLSVTDVTAQRASNERLAYRAHHDHLTGLPNRPYILELLAHSLRPAHDGGVAAVCYVDLHGLKSINDSLGHHAGDTAIQTVAQLLRAVLRPQDIVGRLGGDEFVALLCGTTTRTDIDDVTAGVHAALSQPLIIENVPQSISASVGITIVAESEPRTAAALLRDADEAMYRAKAAGGGRNGFFGV
jgi:diguanylate cyclase (GGDEF)-like protein/PAS domain S-box-containing protein